MKPFFTLLLTLSALTTFAQFNGGSGSGYTRGTGGGVGQCNSAGTVAVHACDSYTLPSGSRTVNVPGTYLDTIPNLANCDSFLTIQLTLSYSTSETISQAGCDSLTFNGTTYTSSGTYIQFLTNTQGCDSVLSLLLAIQESSTGNLTATGCGSFDYHGQTYFGSGTYVQIITNQAGCDSLVTLQLTILPFTANVTQSGTTLTAQQAGATYQWLDCNNGFATIAGQANQSFTPTANGNYAVAIHDGPCADTSACTQVTVTAQSTPVPEAITAFPNPTHGNITVKMPHPVAELTVTTMDMTGRRISQGQCQQCDQIVVALGDAAGIYLVEVQTPENAQTFLKVEKW